ncbi:unnamed protein product [Caenorhabditis angaria]|uniref:Uncharacterized protein n=1 Tax=Caenorhabditis angaria TaxID=860376 RepID=A0A9P1I4M6_9PELO|nr:unnamed protein product [Caenorhabditis angaria]
MNPFIEREQNWMEQLKMNRRFNKRSASWGDDNLRARKIRRLENAMNPFIEHRTTPPAVPIVAVPLVIAQPPQPQPPIVALPVAPPPPPFSPPPSPPNDDWIKWCEDDEKCDESGDK